MAMPSSPPPAVDAAWPAAMSAALAATGGGGPPPRVWLDLGTSAKTLAKWDVQHNSSLIVVGVDPVLSNVQHASQPTTPRFVRVHGACTEGPPSTATLLIHKSVTCASLMPTHARAPKLGTGSDACTGDVPVPMRVPTFPLRLLLRRMTKALAPRVELLKIDVQGSELACLRSAGAELQHVDNLLLEVQDADEGSGLLMYEGAPSLTELDALLQEHGLRRQYCEWNIFSKSVREINCLYSRVGHGHGSRAARLWATGNFQRGGSMVSYDNPPRFVRPPQILRKLKTSRFAGERVARSGGGRWFW
mmetsp:Transcript_33545/g.107863  ORF Transcript_33545/g.107863 Transcript_33545/m.107863 type:complete len:304 (-) Transcript_33545:113-1024(-)